jgi:hypothetical protein
MEKIKFIISSIVIILLILFSQSVWAGPTKVGNGDDGTDLEGFEKIHSGKIVEARKQAVEHLKKVNTPSIKFLGLLLPEVEKADLYMTKKDISAKRLLELGAFTNDSEGLVYARTFPVPHAPTRFFPASKKLSQNQLMALHIHEALHRSLPKVVRNHEKLISEITLSITSPGATRDLIEEKVTSLIQPKLQPSTPQVSAPALSINQTKKEIIIPETSRMSNASVFGLSYKRFVQGEDEDNGAFTQEPLTGMFELNSHLYPFGAKDNAIGIGIDLSILQTKSKNQTGPLGLGLHWLFYTLRGFDFEMFGKASINTLSKDELKNSIIGRDVYTLGININKKNDYFYVSNDIFISDSSDVEEKIGNVNYKYEFGNVTGVKLNVGTYYKSFHFGGFLEMLVSDNFKVAGGALKGDSTFETGRNQVVSAGPIMSWKQKNLGVDFYGRYMINSTTETDYEFLGSILERGIGQGFVGTSLKFFF